MLKLVSIEEYEDFVSKNYGDCGLPNDCDEAMINRLLLSCQNKVIEWVSNPCYNIDNIKDAIIIMTYDELNIDDMSEVDGYVVGLNAYNFLKQKGEILLDNPYTISITELTFRPASATITIDSINPNSIEFTIDYVSNDEFVEDAIYRNRNLDEDSNVSIRFAEEGVNSYTDQLFDVFTNGKIQVIQNYDIDNMTGDVIAEVEYTR